MGISDIKNRLSAYRAEATMALAAEGPAGVVKTWRKHCSMAMNEEGSMNMVNGIIVFIIAAAMMGIGLIIISTVFSALPVMNESDVFYPVQQNLGTITVAGFGLLVISLIIIAAVVLMGGLASMGGGNQI